MKDEFEVRLMAIGHMARMLLEMAQIDFGSLTEAQEAELLEDYEDVATHIVDSMGFEAGPSEDGVSFNAKFTLEDPEKYIRKKLDEETSANP
jgi:hypothetical protein